MITALFLTARGLLMATSVWRVKIVQTADTLVAWLAGSRAALVIFAVPTAATLWFMSGWGMDTPDVSVRPHLPVLTIYGGFFLLGWMLGRQRQLISQFARLAPERWIVAVLGICGIVLLGNIERDPGHPYYVAAHVVYALTYALSMWSLVFLSIGIFERLCSGPNEFVRYIADSSYWMYLIHLPIVLWLQVAVAEVPLHWSLKLAFVSLITILISLLTYDLFVRPTFLGWILNGRRRSRIAPHVLQWILNTWCGKLLGRVQKAEG